jgi:serine protease Do
VKRAFRIVLIVLLALAAIGNGALLAGIVITREPAPKPLTPERVAAASRPAIVFIQSDYTITTSIPKPIITSATDDAIYRQLEALYYAGKIQNTRADFSHAYNQIVLSNPGAYFSAGPAVSSTWDQWATGSGFFVTEDGYLVTAAHVVSASKTEVRDQILAYTKDPTFVGDERTNIKSDWADYGPSDDEINNLISFDQRWIEQYVSVDKIASKYYIGAGASVQAGDNMVTTGARASVVSIDPTVGGHDIAILKAAVTGVPALSIARSDPQMGDATYAIGYPRTAYLQESVPSNQTVPIVVAKGSIQRMNSRTSADGGWKVYGTDAQFTHGDSGGPVLDAKGRVMGVISFIIPDAQGNQLPGQGYFVPSTYINEDLTNAGVNVVQDPMSLTNTYYHALAEGDIQRYKVELKLLEDVQARSSFDAYVKDDILHVQSRVLSGDDQTPPDLTVYAIPAASTAGGVILLALVSWLAIAVFGARRPRPVAAAAPAAEAEPDGGTPPAAEGPPAELTPAD